MNKLTKSCAAVFVVFVVILGLEILIGLAGLAGCSPKPIGKIDGKISIHLIM